MTPEPTPTRPTAAPTNDVQDAAADAAAAELEILLNALERHLPNLDQGRQILAIQRRIQEGLADGSIQPIGQVSPEQIAAWQQRYQHVHEVVFPLDPNGERFGVVYLSPPTSRFARRCRTRPEDSLLHVELALHPRLVGTEDSDGLWLGGYPAQTDIQSHVTLEPLLMQILQVGIGFIKKNTSASSPSA
jgi:hypothetical protein